MKGPVRASRYPTVYLMQGMDRAMKERSSVCSKLKEKDECFNRDSFKGHVRRDFHLEE